MIKNKLKIRMLEKEISGRELAQKIDVSEKTIYNWINNKSIEQIEKFIMMCKVLDLDPRELIE